jgi:hypothetical protein
MRFAVIVITLSFFCIIVVNSDTVAFPQQVVQEIPSLAKRKLLQGTPTPTPTPTPSGPVYPGWNAPVNGTICWDGKPRKSQLTTWLLSFFVGGLGVDRFYTNYIWQGVLKLILPTCGIWWLVDVILYGLNELPDYSNG